MSGEKVHTKVYKKSTFVVPFYISEEKLQRGQSLDVYSGSIIRSRTPLIIYCFQPSFSSVFIMRMVFLDTIHNSVKLFSLLS